MTLAGMNSKQVSSLSCPASAIPWPTQRDWSTWTRQFLMASSGIAEEAAEAAKVLDKEQIRLEFTEKVLVAWRDWLMMIRRNRSGLPPSEDVQDESLCKISTKVGSCFVVTHTVIFALFKRPELFLAKRLSLVYNTYSSSLGYYKHLRIHSLRFILSIGWPEL